MRFPLLCLASLLALTSLRAELPLSLSISDEPCQQVGQSTYEYLGFIRVFTAALYTPDGQAPALPLAAEQKLGLKILYYRNLDREDFIKSGRKFLKSNVSEAEYTSISERFEAFNRLYVDIRKGDTYSVQYDPAQEVLTLFHNGQPLGQIQGADFARAYFTIWFGSDPVSESLKEELLGSA
tara:strand:+ start:1397 stop:1939 length:543 start_codon:yes stop_codon:yes gene_type:complete